MHDETIKTPTKECMERIYSLKIKWNEIKKFTIIYWLKKNEYGSTTNKKHTQM